MEIERQVTENKSKYVVWNDYGSRIIGSATLVKSSDPVELKNINIKRNSRSNGVGSRLLKKILDDFEDSEIIAKTFDARVKWYERHGFEVEENEGGGPPSEEDHLDFWAITFVLTYLSHNGSNRKFRPDIVSFKILDTFIS